MTLIPPGLAKQIRDSLTDLSEHAKRGLSEMAALARQECARANAAEQALADEKAVHAETRAERDEIEAQLRIRLDEALAHQCTPAERKVLEEMGALDREEVCMLRTVSRELCNAELAKRGDKP